MPGQEARRLLGQELAELGDGGVGHLRQVHAPQGPVRVDHVQRGRVVDLAGLDLHVDVVGVPDALELGQRRGQEMPIVEHPVQLGVGADVAGGGRVGVGVDSKELNA